MSHLMRNFRAFRWKLVVVAAASLTAVALVNSQEAKDHATPVPPKTSVAQTLPTAGETVSSNTFASKISASRQSNPATTLSSANLELRTTPGQLQSPPQPASSTTSIAISKPVGDLSEMMPVDSDDHSEIINVLAVNRSSSLGGKLKR